MICLPSSLPHPLPSFQDLLSVYRTLDARAIAKTQHKYEGLFPSLPPAQIEETVRFYFPDDVTPMKELNLMDGTKQRMSHLIAALEEARGVLSDVKKRQAEGAVEVAGLLEQKRKREEEIRALPLSQERALLEMVDGMKWQRDEARREERERREREEEQRALETVRALEKEMAALESENVERQRVELREKYERKAGSGEGEREREMEKRVREKQGEKEREREREESRKESKVAEVLQARMGAEKFQKLQEGEGEDGGGMGRFVGYEKIGDASSISFVICFFLPFDIFFRVFVSLFKVIRISFITHTAYSLQPSGGPQEVSAKDSNDAITQNLLPLLHLPLLLYLHLLLLVLLRLLHHLLLLHLPLLLLPFPLVILHIRLLLLPKYPFRF